MTTLRLCSQTRAEHLYVCAASGGSVIHGTILPPCTQVLVAQKVTAGVYKGVTTTELDELAAETAASLTATHPDYALVRVVFSLLVDVKLIIAIHTLLLDTTSTHLTAGCTRRCVQPAQADPKEL